MKVGEAVVYKDLEHPDDSQLDGCFKQGRLFGYGIMENLQTGDKYTGMFKDGNRSG